MTTSTTAVLYAAISLTGLVGCGSRDPGIVPVSGRFLIDGKPLPLKDVAFVPIAGTAGPGSCARTRDDGSFELVAFVPGAVKIHRGARPGAYAVIVSEPDFAAEAEPGQPVPKGAGIQVPAVYQDAAKTPLQAEVGGEGREFVFELSSKTKAK